MTSDLRITGPANRIVLRLAALALMSLTSLCAAADEARRTSSASDAASLKAAFLYNFALYTAWPNSHAASLVLCTFGRDDLGSAFDALGGKTIDNKPVQIRRVDVLAEAKSCQLLYVGEAAAGSLPAIARAMQSSAVLVVSDAPGAAEHAMIHIEPDGNRFAFSVNLPRVRAAGLDLSARLLRLARSVR